MRDGSARIELAFWLNDWRDRHDGKPTQESIAKLMPYGRNAVRARLYGNQFPEPEFVWAVISTSGVTPEQRREWSNLYQQLERANRQQEAGGDDVKLPAPPSWVEGEETDAVVVIEDDDETDSAFAAEKIAQVEVVDVPGEDPRTTLEPDKKSTRITRRTTLVLLCSATLVLVAVALAVTLTPSSRSGTSRPTRAITVQNKVAIRATELVEDKTPSYLSTEPRSYCANEVNACKVAGSEMSSGAAIDADCVVIKDEIMVNYNLKDPDSPKNPDAVESRLWYHGTRHGQSGYISEVYIVERDRGGIGLPNCGP